MPAPDHHATAPLPEIDLRIRRFRRLGLGRNPKLRFICVSYSDALAAALARQFRQVVNSGWYRALFPGTRLSKDAGTECVTTAGGGRLATSIGGTLTGRGADMIIVNDPLKAEDASSKTVRDDVNEWYTTALVSRLNDKARDVMIVLMQRLHEDDLAGHLLQSGDWHHLNLPAIAEEDQSIALGPEQTHDRKRGDVLHPGRESLQTLMRIKEEVGSLTFPAQYQQSPVPHEGNLIRRQWLKYYDQLPERDTGWQIVQSWDVATTVNKSSDYSVCTTWAVHRQTCYLVEVWRGQLGLPGRQARHRPAGPGSTRKHDPDRKGGAGAAPGSGAAPQRRRVCAGSHRHSAGGRQALAHRGSIDGFRVGTSPPSQARALAGRVSQ